MKEKQTEEILRPKGYEAVRTAIPAPISEQLDADLLRNPIMDVNTCCDTFGEGTSLTEICDMGERGK